MTSRDDQSVRPELPYSHLPRWRESGALVEAEALTTAISAAIAGLYRDFNGHDRATATTYVNDNVVLCVLEDVPTTEESRLVAFGSQQDVIDGRAAFQTGAQDAFTSAIENLTARRVAAFMSATQTTPGCACELFFLERANAADLPAGARA